MKIKSNANELIQNYKNDYSVMKVKQFRLNNSKL